MPLDVDGLIIARSTPGAFEWQEVPLLGERTEAYCLALLCMINAAQHRAVKALGGVLPPPEPRPSGRTTTTRRGPNPRQLRARVPLPVMAALVPAPN